MPGLFYILISLSLLGLIIISVYQSLENKNWRSFALKIISLVVFTLFLYKLFGSPILEPKSTPRGSDKFDPFMIIALYICMVFGIAAQALYDRLARPRRKRAKFDWGQFTAPFLPSPIVFLPLLAAMQNAGLDLEQLDVPRLMLFFVAFENGFFWRGYFEQRRLLKAKNEI